MDKSSKSTKQNMVVIGAVAAVVFFFICFCGFIFFGTIVKRQSNISDCKDICQDIYDEEEFDSYKDDCEDACEDNMTLKDAFKDLIDF